MGYISRLFKILTTDFHLQHEIRKKIVTMLKKNTVKDNVVVFFSEENC